MKNLNFDSLIILYPGVTNYQMVSNPANYSLSRLFLLMNEDYSKSIFIYNWGKDNSTNKNLRFIKFNLFRILLTLFHLRKKKIVIISMGFRYAKLALWLRTLFDVKIVVRTGGIFWGREYLESIEFSKVIHKYSYLKKADIFLSTADGTPVDLFLDKIGMPNEKRCVWLNGFPEVNFYKNENRENSILCVSRLSSEKGMEFVIRAFGASYPLLTQKYVLNIIGDGPDKDKLKSICKELNIDNVVNFLGHKDGVLPYFLKSKLLLNPLANNTIIEGIVARLPIVTLELGELKSLYKDFPNIRFISYKKGGYGIMPTDQLEQAVEIAKIMILEILNNNYNISHYDIDYTKYGWSNRLENELTTYSSLFS